MATEIDFKVKNGLVVGTNATITNTLNSANLAYTGTLTGGTGVLAIGTNQIYKDASGNVGIGTSNPTGPLTIASSATVAAGNPSLIMFGSNNTERISIFSSVQPCIIGNGFQGTYAVPVAVGSTNTLIDIQARGYDGVSYGFGARIQAIPEATWTTISHPATLVFSTTASGSTTNTERLRITSAGGVSFGATGTAYGTSGQVLTSAGNAAPTWQTPTVGTVTSVAALTLGTTGTDVSSTVATGNVTPVITLNIPTASATNRGALSSTDWSTFNGKQAAGSYLTVGGALGTPSSGTLTNCTFPTLNQNTTGSSASCTGNAATATNVAWSGITSKPTTRAGYGITDAANNAAPLDGVTSSGTIAASASLPVQVYSAGAGHASMMSFHKPGNYAANIGIDTDNVWKVGGWSMGANSYAIYHAGNPQPSVSGSSGSCTGNAGTATTATNQSGGTVSATTGAFSGSLTTNSFLRVGNGLGASDIYMADSDEGERRIHCNSNRIGFLNQSAGWGAWCEDDGSWGSAGTISGTNITTGGNVTGSSTSCTGNAATVTGITQQNGTRSNLNFNTLLSTGFYNYDASPTNGPGYAYGQVIVAQGADTGWQIAGGYTNSMSYRGWYGSGGGFTAWKTLLDSSNYNSYSPTLTGGGASGSWNITATNQSGGTVSATTGAFSGAVSMSNNIQFSPNSTYGINFNGASTDMHRIYLDGYWTIFKSHVNEGWKFRDNSNIDKVTITGPGNVGIGTASPQGKLQVAGVFNTQGVGPQDGNDRPSVSITGYYPQLVLMSGGTGNTNHGATISLGAFDTGTSGALKSWTLGTPGQNATYLDIGYGTSTNPHLNGISGYGTPVMRLATTGVTTPVMLNANGNIIINNGSPTLYFQDTDQMCAMLHTNGNTFHVLRGGINTTAWATTNGYWPLTINLSNNDITCGGNLIVVSNITAYASDKRLKENIVEIPNAIEKIKKIRGVTFDWNDISETQGFRPQQKYNDIGVIAQEIEEVLPQVVTLAPFDTWQPNPDIDYSDEELEEKTGTSKSGENYKTVQYDRIVPLLIQAIKEQQIQIDELKELINKGK